MSSGCDVLDREVAVRDGGEADEAADLDVLGRDRPLPAAAAARRRGCAGRSTRCPSISAPSETRKRQRSCTCGSQAALPIVVSPGVRTAAITVFSVAITLASSRKISRAAQPVRLHLVAALDLDLARRAARARGCAGRAGAGRSRRRPAAARSPGRGARAAGRRGGTTPGSAPRAPRRPRTTRAPAASTRTSFGPVHSALAPVPQTSSSIVSTSRMRGTFESVTGSSASRHAARIGSAPFLFPEARMRPLSGFPPSMTRVCGAVVTDMPG